jgi:AraC-like DNA-binding protein
MLEIQTSPLTVTLMTDVPRRKDSPDGVLDDDTQSALTRNVVMRYHLSWKHRDLEAILALYHPDVSYNDFFQNRCMGLQELRAYVFSTLPRHPDEFLEHTDRIRIDGNTAFIQYQTSLQAGQNCVTFYSSEAIVVRDGLIYCINEYASLVRDKTPGDSSSVAAISKLGLSARQLTFMARDLDDYFQGHRPFLDPELNLQQVAAATGYSRNQMSYLLNQVLGQTFYRYVTRARLDYLIERLSKADSATCVDELAAQAGFNSTSAFYKAFRAHTGTTPKAWLKENSSRARA